MIDLWPLDISQVRTKLPIDVLSEQASIITQKSNGLLRTKVSRADVYIPNNQGVLMYNLFVTTPTEPPSPYRLFFITYDIDLYPVNFYITHEDMHHELELYLNTRFKVPLKAFSEDQFISILKVIFNSEATRRVMSLMVTLYHRYQLDEEI